MKLVNSCNDDSVNEYFSLHYCYYYYSVNATGQCSHTVMWTCGALQTTTKKAWWTTYWRLWRLARRSTSTVTAKTPGDGHQEQLEVQWLSFSSGNNRLSTVVKGNMLSVCPSATFVHPFIHLLMNGLSNLSVTYTEYSLAPTDDQIRF